jgi:multidrug transporter EmrE-like cation transporter
LRSSRSMTSMMDILSGATPLIVDVRQSGSGPVLSCAAITVLDLAGTVFAKEWAIRRAPGLLLIGLAVHAVLFTVFAISMRRVPMTVVTAVWCALVLIAVPLIDWLRYGTRLGADRCSAVALIVVAGTYLATRADA